MEMRPLSLWLETPGSGAAQFIESRRRTAANTCIMPATPATRNVRCVALPGQGPPATFGMHRSLPAQLATRHRRGAERGEGKQSGSKESKRKRGRKAKEKRKEFRVWR